MPKPRKAKSRKTKARKAPRRMKALKRGAGEGRGLGQQLLDTVENIIELMDHTQDPERLRELNAERVALSNEAKRLIEASLDTSSTAYRRAVAGLEAARATLREAIKGLESVKNAILSAAEAVELVAKIAAVA